MKQKDYQIAQELKEHIGKVTPLIDCRIFGSRARGNATEDSDMDLFLEVETLSRELKERIADIIWEIGFKHYLVISTLIFTRNEIEQSALKDSPIVQNILQEGVII